MLFLIEGLYVILVKMLVFGVWTQFRGVPIEFQLIIIDFPINLILIVS